MQVQLVNLNLFNDITGLVSSTSTGSNKIVGDVGNSHQKQIGNTVNTGIQTGVKVANDLDKIFGLQNLSFFSGLENDAKTLAGDAWSGANACYANAACKATVEKYGTAAGEAFMKKIALQELGFFSGASNWIHGAEHTVENTFTSGFNTFKADASAAAKKMGPGFKIAGKDMEWAAGKTWQGAQWCYQDAPCKAAVEKYGMMAVQKGMTAAASLQELSFGSFMHSVEHDAGAAVHAVEPIAKYAAGKAWQGTQACYASASCKASVEKVGLAATEAAFALQQQQIIILV